MKMSKDGGDNLFGDVEIISVYTRAQAIADGLIVDIVDPRPFACPVGLTRAVWDHYVQVPRAVIGQDETGRLWDILWMAHLAGIRTGASEYRFQVHVRNDNREGMPPVITLQAALGDDGDGAPYLTVMLPEEM